MGERVTEDNIVGLWETAFLRKFEIRVGRAVFNIRPNTYDIASYRAEPKVLRILSSVSQGCFVDVGSHMGYYAVMMSVRISSEGRVIAIEPEPQNFDALVANVERNKCTNVTALNIAAYSEDRNLTLWGPPNPRDRGLFTLGESTHFSKRSRVAYITAKRLDEVLRSLGVKKVDCMKVDTEGTEAEVLKGAGDYLSQCELVVFEAWDDVHLGKCLDVIQKSGRFVVHRLDSYNYVAVRVHS